MESITYNIQLNYPLAKTYDLRSFLANYSVLMMSKNQYDYIKYESVRNTHDISYNRYEIRYMIWTLKSNKEGCVFPLFVLSILPHALLRLNDHRKDHFRIESIK